MKLGYNTKAKDPTYYIQVKVFATEKNNNKKYCNDRKAFGTFSHHR